MAVAVLGLLLAASASRAQQVISYQGLAQSNGTPLTGSHNLAIGIYADSTGGTAMYTESQYGVAFVGGLFNIEIGTNKANPLPIFQAGNYSGSVPAPDYFLGISIDGNPELMPRSKLGAAPTAWSSRFADSARLAGTATTALTATTAINLAPAGNAGQVLTSNGASVPTWQNASGVPSGAIVTFGDSGVHSGYSFTGFTGSIPVGGDSWSTGTASPAAQSDMISAVVNGKIYVIGGDAGITTNNKIYDPVTDSWSTGAALPVGQYMMAGAVVNGKIYVIGGLGGSQNNNQIYDPVTNTWSTGAPLPVAQSYMTSAVVKGKIYVLGGSTNGGSNYIYDPNSNMWTSGAMLPVGQFTLTSAVVNGKIYVIGGANGIQNNNQIYDPDSNTWSTGRELPVGQSEMTSSVVNGKIYVMGGLGGSENNNQIYDPVANTWSIGAVLPAAQYGMVSAVVNGKIYVIGGRLGSGNNNQIYTPGLTLYYFTKN